MKPLAKKEAQGLLKERATDTLAGTLLAYLRQNASLLPDTTAVTGYIRGRLWEKVLDWAEFGSVEHLPLDQYFARTQFAALVKKYPFTRAETPGLDPEATALTKFLKSEHRCKRVNQRLRAMRRSKGRYENLLSVARRWVEWVLGTTPLPSEWYPMCDFGPGAAIGVHGDATSFARKLNAKSWTVGSLARPYAFGALWSNFHIAEWLLSKDGGIFSVDKGLFREAVENRLRLTEHSSITFVPKTAKTHRVIAVEPLLNGFLQHGVGELMAHRLRRVGCDLKDQAPNQRMAREGSLGMCNPYATLDLSAASDSVAIEVVRELLPPDWFELLMELRCPRTRLPDGREIVLQKISSMGNGFTFPLETLVFASVCHAAAVVSKTRPDFRVYGDDIIVRQDLALLVVEVLDYLGFKVNRDKSFFFGPFRESCGADWLGGIDVRPTIVDNRLGNLAEVFAVHNGMRRNDACKATLGTVQTVLRDAVPREWRFMRPVLGALDSAFEVAEDIFLSEGEPGWCPDLQRHVWRELTHTPVVDFPTDFRGSATLMMVAALRGGSSAKPFVFRRRTKAGTVRTVSSQTPTKRELRRSEALWSMYWAQGAATVV